MRWVINSKEYKQLSIKVLCIAVTCILIVKAFPGLTQNFEYKISDLKFKIRNVDKSINYRNFRNKFGNITYDDIFYIKRTKWIKY